MLLKRLFVVYQRHIQIFLTMNSVIKVQNSTFLYLCGDFNFIQGNFHFLCHVVTYIFTKKLISPSIDDQDEYVERLSTGNSLFQNTWLAATACSMVWKCGKSHKSRWSKHSFCNVENSIRRKITKVYGYVPPPYMTRPLRRNFKLLFLVCRKYVYLKHKMFVHNLSVILICMPVCAYTAKGCF